MDYILPKEQRKGTVPDTHTTYKHFMDTAWPAVLQGLLIQLASVIDLAMVGSLGAAGLAAVGIFSQPKMALLIFVRALCMPIIAIVARRFGEGDYKNANATLKQGILLSFLVYIPLIFLSYHFMAEILYFAGASDSFIESATAFGRYVSIGLIFSAYSQIVGAGLIGVGNTKMIFYSNAIGNIVNTILNAFLIFGLWGAPRLGVEGAGIATMVGDIVTAIIITTAVCKKSSPLNLLDNSSWRFTYDTLHSIYHIGSSSLGEQVFERFGMFTYTKMVASLGVVPLAAHHVCMALCDIFYLLDQGLSQASASHVGQSLGKKRPDMALAYGKVGTRVGLLFSIIGAISYIVFDETLLWMFSSDTKVIDLGQEILLIVALVCFPQSYQMVYSGVLRGAGDNYFVMVYSLISIAIVRPILTYVLCFPLGIGLFGAWIALFIDQSTRMCCSYWRFKQGQWQTIKI